MNRGSVGLYLHLMASVFVGFLSLSQAQAANLRPVANAGPDQVVGKMASVSLTGSGSDPDGSIVAYRWLQTAGPAVNLDASSQASASFIAPTLAAQKKLTFRLTVTDNKGGTASDSVVVTVRANAKPVANAGPDQVVNRNLATSLVGSGSDVDGQIVSYQWLQTAGPSVTLSGADRASASFIAPMVASQTRLVFRLTVTDNDGAAASDQVAITVRAVNAQPSANAGPDQTVLSASSVQMQGIASDPDGNIVSYQWLQTVGQAVALNGASQSGASFVAPTVNAPTLLGFRLTVTDNSNATASDDMVVTVNPAPATTAEQWVMGYYVAYQRALYPPEAIDWNGLSHVIMARVKANADGSLDTNFDWDPVNGPALAMDIAARAHAAGRKAILMLGGDDNGAEILSAVTHHRAAFIANLRDAMIAYGYDGLDLDWENQIDWNLFQLFAQELRQAMPSAILTLPTGPLNINYDVVEPHLPAIAEYLDRVNLMSYYPATSWAGAGWLSWYNSPLSGVKPATPVSIEESLKRYADAGIAKAKLGMGIAFYSTCYTGGITGPNQSTEAGVSIAGGDNDSPLLELFGTNGAYSEADRYWDNDALQPYLSLPEPERHGCRYVTFEDEQSIVEKGRFSRNNGYGGSIVWTVNQGYVNTHAEPNFLLQALRQGFLEPNATQPVGISVMQGNLWVKPLAQARFSALVTGTTDKAVAWSVLESGCGAIDAQGRYTAPATERTCTVSASSLADPARTARATVTISDATWAPSFSVLRRGTWWVEITAQDSAVAAMSMQQADGTAAPLTAWGTQWDTGYPVFVANRFFPDAGGVYTFIARSADNRSAEAQLVIPACTHSGDGICQ